MAESAPTESESFYRVLVENASEGMLTIDTDSQIVYANPAIEEILGYTPDELIGSSKMEIIPERLRSAHATALRAYVESGEKNIDWDGIELPALHKDGHEVPTLISLREHEHDGERLFTGIVRDITDQRQRENRLKAQNQRLDEFAEVLSHDIKNPLSIARGYTELLREDYDDPELEQVAESLGRIDEIIDDMMTMSKDGQFVGETERVDISTFANGVWRTIVTDGAELVIEDDVGAIECDKSQFRELLSNLLRNAVTHGGPTVTVRIGRLADRDGIYIEDDGPGVEPEIRDSIFEHGYSTREGGTGYGLAIVDRIASAHGWDVRVTESSTGGARFELLGVSFS